MCVVSCQVGTYVPGNEIESTVRVGWQLYEIPRGDRSSFGNVMRAVLDLLFFVHCLLKYQVLVIPSFPPKADGHRRSSFYVTTAVDTPALMRAHLATL